MKKLKAYQVYVPVILFTSAVFFIWGGISSIKKIEDLFVWSFGSFLVSIGLSLIFFAVYSIKETVDYFKAD